MKINKTNKTNRSAAGFTLVESLVAMTIGAIMLTSLYGCFASGFSTVKTSRENMRATQIMLSRLENVRLATTSQLTNSTYFPTTFTESFNPGGTSTNSGGVVYNGTFSAAIPAVGSLPESYRTNMLLLTVTLNWTSAKMAHTRTMQSYAARDGMSAFVSVGR